MISSCMCMYHQPLLYTVGYSYIERLPSTLCDGKTWNQAKTDLSISIGLDNWSFHSWTARIVINAHVLLAKQCKQSSNYTNTISLVVLLILYDHAHNFFMSVREYVHVGMLVRFRSSLPTPWWWSENWSFQVSGWFRYVNHFSFYRFTFPVLFFYFLLTSAALHVVGAVWHVWKPGLWV